MIRAVLGALLLIAVPAAAQMMPQPGPDNPRLQTVQWTPGVEVVLTALPMTGLTVLLEPGEQIVRIAAEDPRLVEVRVSAERDSVLLIPAVTELDSPITVATDRREYRLRLRTGTGLMAAYLVRFRFDGGGDIVPITAAHAPEPFTGPTWGYRLRGNSAVRPASIRDDGARTRIVFAPEQALPAVFAIGPGGEEQVAGGYMRGGVFEIDRVWQELVFRIDGAKATARRERQPEASGG